MWMMEFCSILFISSFNILQPNSARRWSDTSLPDRQLLNIIDQRCIISLRELAEHEKEEHEIEFSKASIFPPRHVFVVAQCGMFQCLAVNMLLGSQCHIEGHLCGQCGRPVSVDFLNYMQLMGLLVLN